MEPVLEETQPFCSTKEAAQGPEEAPHGTPGRGDVKAKLQFSQHSNAFPVHAPSPVQHPCCCPATTPTVTSRQSLFHGPAKRATARVGTSSCVEEEAEEAAHEGEAEGAGQVDERPEEVEQLQAAFVVEQRAEAQVRPEEGAGAAARGDGGEEQDQGRARQEEVGELLRSASKRQGRFSSEVCMSWKQTNVRFMFDMKSFGRHLVTKE